MLGGWPRRVLAVGCLLAAAVAGLQRPPLASVPAGGAPAGVPVLVAAADLAAGARLTAADVRAVPIPDDLVPAGALRPSAGVLGRIVAGPMRRGEPLTDARLLGRGLATGLSPPESVAVPVRLADGQTAALVRPGDRIDVLATPVDGAVGPPAAAAAPPGGTSAAASDPAVAADPPAATGATGRPAGAGSAVDATVLAAALRVLAVLADPQAAATDGALVVVATSDRVARRLTAAAAQQRLSIALRPP
jgi:pilus assembly protein CpaB